MAGYGSLKLTVVTFFLVFCIIEVANAYPSVGKKYDLMSGYDFLGVCLSNCAQCKKMFGSYFEGPRCAESCVKLRGKVIPDCEDIASIAPFLNKLD